MFGAKMVIWLLIGMAAAGYLLARSQDSDQVEDRAALSARQLDSEDPAVAGAVRRDNLRYGLVVPATVVAWLGLGALLFSRELARIVTGDGRI